MKNNSLTQSKLYYLYILFILIGCICITSCKTKTKEKSNKTTIEDNSFGTEIGHIMPNFIQKNPNEKNISLNDYRGTYLLVDFWASWCNPCRKENKNLVKLFHKFKDKNFTILSISLDKVKSDWLKAIKDDKLEWEHVSDLKFLDNEIAQKFDIKYIPYNFLLNPQGVIIAKNIYGEKLTQKLNHFLNINK